jgi:hypothetical protein
MSEPGDDHLSRAQNELGDPEAFFQISRGRFHAKLWGALGLIVGSMFGIAVLIAVGAWDVAGIFAKLLLTPPVIGVAILWHMYRQRGLTVLVYPTGLLRLQRGEVDSFPWDDIAEIRMKLQRLDSPRILYDSEGDPTQCWLPVETPTFQIWKAGITVMRTDDTEAHFGPALAEFDRLAKLIQRKTFPRAWADAREQLLSGETVVFGDLDVSPAGLRHAGKKLPWRDVKELTIAQGRLTIKKVGGWLPWAILDVSKVPNPHVLFALVGEARRFSRSPAPSQPHKDEADHTPRQND